MHLVRTVLISSLFVATCAVATAQADEANFNRIAAGNAAAGNGSDNANCSAAIILGCDDNAPAGAPGPAVGGLALLIAGAGVFWARRRQRG